MLGIERPNFAILINLHNLQLTVTYVVVGEIRPSITIFFI